MKRIPTAVVTAALSLCALLSSCSLEEDGIRRPDTLEVNGRELPSSVFEQGKVRVLLTEELVSKLEMKTDSTGVLQSCGVKSVDDAISSIGITKMVRTFPYAGKFEPRTRKAGLHLWYDVYFDESVALTRAGDELSRIQGVSTVEYRPKVVRVTGRLVPESVTSSPESPVTASADVFDDPMLYRQWHYYNDGSIARTIAGSDINVLPVWEKGIVGNADVIVSVVDGGIDYDHEDLADNMWVNPDPDLSPAESHGYNFVKHNYKITDDEHGTHVAGTVAAVNNNGIGVCGVAGGDKARGIPGVKLMSCQIFEGRYSGDGVAAIKWGADHGAVISQNSWGYDPLWINDTPASDKAAIDYFIEYAGFDENGVQTGPMAGGVVIFAAGNDEMNIGYPAEYESCIAVSAIAGDFEDAYYTNYGEWVDVAAPGGDEFKGHLVYSTLPNNRYGEMQGTSMACPHVSGMAALLVSHFGGPGFTNEMLREMIETSVKDISQYTDPNKYMGKGLIDVEVAISMDSDIAPDPVTKFSASAHSNFIDFSLVIPADADADDCMPAIATLHYSTTDFDPSDSLAVNDLPFYEIKLKGMKVGDEVSGTAAGMEFNTDYYVSASVRDYARNRSKLYPSTIKVRTGSNTPPEIIPGEDMEIDVPVKEEVNLDFEVKDPDGHTVQAEITEYSGISMSKPEENIVRITFKGKSINVDEGTVTLTVSDGFGGDASVDIKFRVVTNYPPEVTDAPTDIVMNLPSDDTKLVNLGDYFKDKDGDKLVYSVNNSNENVLTASVQDRTLVITDVTPGMSEVTVTAFDKELASVAVTFNVLVRDGSRMADFYPNPMENVLNIRTGEEATDASLTIRDSNGNTRISEQGLGISPSKPVSIDVSGLAGGIYKATLKWTAPDGKVRTVTADLSKI